MVDKIEKEEIVEIKGLREHALEIGKSKQCNNLFDKDEYVHDFEWTSEMEENAKKLLQEDEKVVEDIKTSIYIDKMLKYKAKIGKNSINLTRPISSKIVIIF